MLNNDSVLHTEYMRHALSLAKRHTGKTSDNPSVGCIIVKDNHIIGRGVTAQGGRPHAEKIALNQAGHNAQSASLYVTLEPCAHYGKTPPCAEAIIKSGIKNVFIGITDLDMRVQGRGIDLLKKENINVYVGLLEEEIKQHHAPFLVNITEKRPYYTIKFAASLDGKINFYPNKYRKKISSDFDHLKAHQLRHKHHAIAVGIGTMQDDNPRLDCRLKGLEAYSPDIIIFDRLCRVDAHCNIFQKNTIKKQRRVFIFHAENSQPKFAQDNVIYAPIADNFTLINEFLMQHQIFSVLVEGGATLHTAFLNAGLYDHIIHFSGNMIIGQQAKAAFGFLEEAIDLA